ncbi:MAG TPA: hypothetical protein VI383_09540, partial [Gemmatimonadales bacterium]|nr:hypothetical protein [Gemmatimonadales bacterium]
MAFTDEWLLPTVAGLVPEEQIVSLRRDAGNAGSLWEALVDRRILGDDQILQAVSARFRIPVTDLAMLDSKVLETVPEQVARKYQVLPIRTTDSFLEVATANPFDIESEKMLAFATGREVRLLLLSPSRIREKLDEMYRPEDVVRKLLTGIAENAEVTQLSDEPDEYRASAEEAQARPIIKLVDTLIADGITSRAS